VGKLDDRHDVDNLVVDGLASHAQKSPFLVSLRSPNLPTWVDCSVVCLHAVAVLWAIVVIVVRDSREGTSRVRSVLERQMGEDSRNKARQGHEDWVDGFGMVVLYVSLDLSRSRNS
jgi:hypothetical protein